MRTTPSLPKALALAALVAASAACGDDVTDPATFLESAEAEAVLRSAAALPALPAIIDGAPAPSDAPARSGSALLVRARELWNAGTATNDAAGRARRRLAVRHAAPALAARVPAAEWDRIEQGLLGWTHTAESMLRHVDLPEVRERLRTARTLLSGAAAAKHPEARARALLLAGAELVETTPRFVARDLTAEAGRAVTRAESDRGADAERVARAARLKDWAARAVEDGEYLLAVQRAYYAIQLAEAR